MAIAAEELATLESTPEVIEDVVSARTGVTPPSVEFGMQIIQPQTGKKSSR